MSNSFTSTQRQLQNEFEVIDCANSIVEVIVTEELPSQQIEFICNSNMFYLSTTEKLGYPSYSYRFSAIGF